MNFIDAYDIGVNKPNIPENIYSNWQDTVDTLASIADVPSALIMHVLPDKIEVARTSHTQPKNNPYDVEDSLQHINVSVEVIDYTPMHLTDLRRMARTRLESINK